MISYKLSHSYKSLASAHTKDIIQEGVDKVQKNIGTLNAILRITIGLVGLAYCSSRSRRRFPVILAFIFAMKIAEGMIHYCPMVNIWNKYLRDYTEDLRVGKTLGRWWSRIKDVIRRSFWKNKNNFKYSSMDAYQE
jgi:hypothetical protein